MFPTAKFNYWYTHLPNCRFANFYGPIEITLDCLFYEIKSKLEDSSPIPIGRPFRNTSVMVLDDENKLILDESEGELCIRGSSLAMGYYANKEKKITKIKITYCPRIHNDKVMKKWEEQSGENWYLLSPESRQKANEEMSKMIKNEINK